MEPAVFMLVAFVASIAAGVLGALVGLGGGIIVVPALTLFLGVEIRYAIGASIISVIATSSAASARYIRDGLANLRVGMLLEPSTAIGGVLGGVLAGLLDPRWLYLCFGSMMALTALAMSRQRDADGALPLHPDPLARKLGLHGTVPGARGVPPRVYEVVRVRTGMSIAFGAGIMSGLLGVGGGIVKVPTMSLIMGMPLKAATATSTLMIGVTAAASAGVYISRGDVDPLIAGPVAAGVLVGASFGGSVLGRTRSGLLRAIFIIVLLVIALRMVMRGFA
ncbi:MAG TPA: sulfite exporter TauE/SafE family protein [Phycisphaerales bacterium]|nr:sulfite exporter TauE/SafE family protein [Phycisphaerales bacterium]HMP36819.1 sulfite exporter TauE/SafE family protein [Phycisphaerales bacterium]